MFLLSFLAAKKTMHITIQLHAVVFDCCNSFVICLKHFFQMIVTLS